MSSSPLRPGPMIALLALLPVIASASSAPLCGTRATPPAVWEHVVWVFFENHTYGQVVGSAAAPFMNRTLGTQCGLATNYHGVAHPSLPNYIAATSGVPVSALGPLRNDCNATGNCRSSADSLFGQVASWRTYAESMHQPCTHWFTGLYAASKNPAVYYRKLAATCATNDVNLRELATDLAADTLPAFAFVAPNMCHNMHNCAVNVGDRWLSRWLTRLTDSPAYQRGTTAIFITFDESDKDGSDTRVATWVVSPSTPPGARTAQNLSHYALLRTTEEMLGIGQLLGQAAHAHSMRAAFNL